VHHKEDLKVGAFMVPQVEEFCYLVAQEDFKPADQGNSYTSRSMQFIYKHIKAIHLIEQIKEIHLKCHLGKSFSSL
jgi:hypothetical protein